MTSDWREVSVRHVDAKSRLVRCNAHVATRTSRTLAAKEQTVRIELRVQAFMVAPVAFR